MNIYGYFDSPYQVIPAYDPGLGVPCPVCGATLIAPVVTLSVMLEDDSRSYFYRCHRTCYERLTDDQRTALDSAIIDAVAKTRDVN